MQDSYALEAAEHERVYANIIEPAFFLDTSSVENPKVVFVGGQPGAGKTKLFKMSMEEFADDNVVPINTDELRAFHSQFVEITEATINFQLSARIRTRRLGIEVC
jgi:Cdc6-like AAA superfamily ATPase